MRRWEIRGPGRLRAADAAVPTPRSGWARLRVLACGVCATDTHLLDGSVRPPGAADPIVPGHEVAGVVEEIGDPETTPANAAGDAERARTAGWPRQAPDAGDASARRDVPRRHPPVRVGDLVVAHVIAPCGSCDWCASGHEQRCQHARTLGIQDPGGLAEEMIWPVSRLVRAPGVDPAQAALLADTAATAHHALRAAAVPGGGLLCVVGAGGVGTGALELARALDPDVRLAAVVRSEASAARIEAMGIPAVQGLQRAARSVKRRVGPADAVIDFTGSPQAPPEAVKMLRPGGRLVVGSVAEGELTLGWLAPFVSREISVTGVYTSTLSDLAEVVELARSGSFDLSGSVTHRVPLSRAPEAFDLLERRPPGMVRVVVEPDGRDAASVGDSGG